MSGTVVFVVGPSGAGKDTVLGYAKNVLQGDERFRFVRRTITRPAGGNEDHESVLPNDFLRIVREGGFALHWNAHGLAYGLPIIVDEWLAAGRVVIANGSRGALNDARSRFQNLVVLNITASLEVLVHRVTERGRETERAIKARLNRGQEFAVGGDDVISIDNSGPIDHAGQETVRHLLRVKDAAGKRCSS
ncbi:phosphonate metabolism protein/1,5-bisphosphokinase (PRPP-forming) PhnN [Mesorhizobium sp. IRAMC:0171]|uniref:Ribose 1,5-bisphosphate phosphokinase PhnN n=2 Tax=Mesorhizobium retamae TaxID=2912854 RepID=A0ABS9QFL7_9HYPH|nr:phosphonate metabolism protein/1,5-bisphosphokinase (PRPP-forming) PhnN [Mesorhizobium sp. IRAMC:0171]MCG7505424.1 phosphonate metabolism protein/1,5-bisphosphokinase (PRPP-forming) PhnN [Mesorhizobium sp. IRAMC:0171]